MNRRRKQEKEILIAQAMEVDESQQASYSPGGTAYFSLV